MSAPYISERIIEYWLSYQVETFLRNEGFIVYVLPVHQRLEKKLPADHIFGTEKHSYVKIWGFQYKTLYRNQHDYWPISKGQHQELQNFSWVYYCLSKVTQFSQANNALRLACITSPKQIQPPELYSKDLIQCKTVQCFLSNVCISIDKLDSPLFILDQVMTNYMPENCYQTWEMFYQGLTECHFGKKVGSADELDEVFKQFQTANAITRDLHLFIANIKEAKAWHISNLFNTNNSERE